MWAGRGEARGHALRLDEGHLWVSVGCALQFSNAVLQCGDIQVALLGAAAHEVEGLAALEDNGEGAAVPAADATTVPLKLGGEHTGLHTLDVAQGNWSRRRRVERAR